MYNKKTDRELIGLLNKGDVLAFDIIYKRYCKRLYGFVLRYLKDSVDTEEIVQEVFVRIWENRSSVHGYSSFESYLFTVAYNSTISMLRKKITEKKYVEYVMLRQDIETAPTTIDDLDYKELSSRIEKLIDKMPPRNREIFLMSRKNGMSHDEIAKKLGISKNTVKNHIVHTLRYLKEYLDRDMLIGMLFIHLFI